MTGSPIRTEALLDSGAQVNTVGSETEEGRRVLKRPTGRQMRLCSPLGKCQECTVGNGEGCFECKLKKIPFTEEFVVLPDSNENPIVGIDTMRKLDLVEENISLFRTAEALARPTPPMTSAGDGVTPAGGDDSARSTDLEVTEQSGSTRSGREVANLHVDAADGQEPRTDAAGPSRGGIPEVMKSRRVLRIGKRRVDGRSVRIDDGLLPETGDGKRKLGTPDRSLASLAGEPMNDDRRSSPSDDSEIEPLAVTVEEGQLFHRDDLFTVEEQDLEAAEAEEAWMEAREILYEEESEDPLEVIVIEGTPSLREKVAKIVRKLATMFRAQIRPEPARFRNHFTLNVDDEAWVRSGHANARQRTSSAEKQQEMARQIAELLERDCIERCQVSCFSHPVLAKKPNGKWRFCIDYRALNNCTESLGWPLPRIKEMLNRLGARKATYFGVIDLTAGYHQALLDPESRKYTTFKTHTGTYQWKRVPFGLKGAPSFYQEQIAHVLEGLLYEICEVYIDDIIIFGTTEDEFARNLEQVLRRLNEKGVTVNPAKCKFGMTEVEYVGHTISREGLNMSPEKKQKVLDFPVPDTVKQLRGFLGLVNYFRDHVRGHAVICKPLFEMTTQASKRLVWTEEGEAAFRKIKDDIANLQTLFFPDDDAPIFLHTDACKYGLGAYLFQVVEGIERPISFYSRSLRGAELNWSTIEQECFGIICAVREFDHLLRGRPFTIRTDHANLVLMNISQAKKVVRWKMELMEYDFTIEHISGVDNTVADAISRCVADLEKSPEKRRRVQTAQMCRLRLQSGDDDDTCRLSQRLARLHIPPRVENIPDDVFNTIKHFHNELVGHGGVQRTMRLLKSNGKEWRHMEKDVTNYIAQCPCCQKNRMTPFRGTVTKFTLSTTNRPMARLSIDTVGPFPADEEGNEYILVIIDNFSRYTTLWPTKDQTGAAAAKALLRHVSSYGVPDEIQSDGGPQFYSETVTELYRLTQIQRLKSAPYSHQENAIAERAIKTTQEHLRALMFEREIKKEWANVLPLVQRIMNASYHEAIGCSPAQIIFGNSIDLDQHIIHDPPAFEDVELPAWHRKLVDMQETLITRVQEVLKKAAEEHCRDKGKVPETQTPQFPNGSFVTVKYLSGTNNRPPTKLHTPMKGPYRVVGMADDHVQIQDILDLEGHVREVHVSACRPFHFDSTRVRPEEVARRDTDEYFIERILSHEDVTPAGSKTKMRKDCLYFWVRWQGYGPEHDSREPWSYVKDTIPLWTYLHQQGLQKLIPKAVRRADGNYHVLAERA